MMNLTHNFRSIRLIADTSFPYTDSRIAYIVVDPLAGLWQPQNESDLREAAKRLMADQVAILAVWPGQHESDVFLVDDALEFGSALGVLG